MGILQYLQNYAELHKQFRPHDFHQQDTIDGDRQFIWGLKDPGDEHTKAVSKVLVMPNITKLDPSSLVQGEPAIVIDSLLRLEGR